MIITLNVTDSQEAGIAHYFGIAKAQRAEENLERAAQVPPDDPLPALVFEDYASARIGGCLDVWGAEASASTVAAMQLDQKYSAATPEEQQKVEAWSDAQPTGSALA